MRPVLVFVAGFLVLLAAVAVTFFRGESTRERVRIVERGPAARCINGDRQACRDLARALGLHPRRLKRLERRARPFQKQRGSAVSGIPPFVERGGGGAGSPPSGGGPVGRVPPREGNPPAPGGQPALPPAPREPTVDLDAPLVPRVCVGDLVAVNCGD